MSFFLNIVNYSDECISSKRLFPASGCEIFLHNLKECFILEVFSTPFSHNDILLNVLRIEHSDATNCIKQIEDVIKKKFEYSIGEVYKIKQNTFSEQI